MTIDCDLRNDKVVALRKNLQSLQGLDDWLGEFCTSIKLHKEVYRIFEQSISKCIAIRRVTKIKQDAQDIEKEREINQELMKVSSPYILEVLEVIDSPDYIYYLTEYCQGESLWHALNQTKTRKFSQQETLKCILQIAKGVQQLHNQRITHRDLKPENILLLSKYSAGKQFPSLKIADFGLSTKSIIMESIAGTKQYIAPEQAKFQTYTNAVDVWSLGIMFDQLLHGETFYTGESHKQVFDKVLKVQFTVRNPSISKPIQELLIRILRKKAYQRPIIAAIISDIEVILDQRGTCNTLQRPKAYSSSKQIFSKSILHNKQNRLRDRSLCLEQALTHKEGKIPIFKVEGRKAQHTTLKKQSLSKVPVNVEVLFQLVLEKQQQLKKIGLTVHECVFNPLSKITVADNHNTYLQLFCEQKRQFEYLNEMGCDQTHEIKLSQTKYRVQKCQEELLKEEEMTRKLLRNKILQQIDNYIDSFLGQCLL